MQSLSTDTRAWLVKRAKQLLAGAKGDRYVAARIALKKKGLTGYSSQTLKRFTKEIVNELNQ